MRMIDFRPQSNSPTIHKWLWRYGWGSASLVAAFAPLGLLNLFQFCSLIILPFSTTQFRKLNTWLAWCLWAWWDWGIRNLVGVRIEFEGDELSKNETAIVIANHQGMADILVLLSMTNHYGMKDAKWMAKSVLKHVPFFGWSLRYVDFIMLKRNWADDEANIKATFSRYCERGDPFWVFLFPEGTRVTAAKLKASTQWAQERNLTPTKHVLIPRPKGFLAARSGLDAKLNAIYDATVYYGNSVPTMTEIIRGDHDRVVIQTRRTPVSALPTDQEGLRRWLSETFQRKDQILENYRLNVNT